MSRWSITENITAEIGNKISSAMALSQNIEGMHMVVLGITKYELVPATEFHGTARYIWA